ncbi:MAG: flagellar brake protein [Gallionellaceae bacterium]|nr:flagellar brake protein [Gallionellaceae bacterium]
MSLMFASSSDLVIGKPVPWAVYDESQNPILGQGEIVRDAKHQADLLAAGACYEASLEVPVMDNVEAPIPAKPASAKVAAVSPMPPANLGEAESPFAAAKVLPEQAAVDQANKQYTFDDMRLKVEDRLLLEPPAKLGLDKLPVRVLGYLRGASLIVTTPFTPTGQRLQLIENETVVMRSFSGQNAFAFACNVVRICRLPYEYLHLSFPENIQGMMIRKAPRVKTRIIAAVHDSHSASDKQTSALISDISAKGISLDSKQQLGEKGEVLNIAFRVQLHNVEAFLALKGVIRAVIKNDEPDSKSPPVRHGIEFQDLPSNDSVVLQSMIYQQMIENPDKLM